MILEWMQCCLRIDRDTFAFKMQQITSSVIYIRCLSVILLPVFVLTRHPIFYQDPPVIPVMDFKLFRQFPPEIQLEVLKQCARNDLVCLSLTSHELRLLSTPLITSKPKLEWVDQLGSTADVPHGCPLDKSEMNYRSTCEGVRGKELHYNSWQHRRKRHTVSGRLCYPCNYYPDNHPTCDVPYCKKHCLCISCPLFTRLRGWMGERRYCSDCRKFTIRHKRNKGRCKLPIPH